MANTYIQGTDLNNPLASVKITTLTGTSYVVASGGSFLPQISGAGTGGASIGSAAFPFNTVTASTFSGTSITGTSLSVSNITGTNLSATNLTSDITLTSGTDILNSVSGINNLGSAGFPFSGVYTNQINSLTAVSMVYFYKPSGSIDGSNATFTLGAIPYSNIAIVYENGIRLNPSGLYSDFDYYLSGSSIIFVTPPATGSKIVVDYARQ